MRVHEVFASIQGETSRAGLPTFFIRTTGCNLRCAWCDTTEAFEGGEERSVEELVAKARSSGLENVTLTGGEPLLQSDAPKLVEQLLDAGLDVQIETNGSLDISPLDRRASRIIDMKPPGSGEETAFLESNLEELSSRDEVKMVLRDRADYEWAIERIGSLRLAEPTKVLLAPAWGELDPKALARWILDDRLPVRLNLQIHKTIWGGDARGV
ncbi:MAG: 7-carboxy-7-deazaguanine synthase QueE [Gemmatimonadetes bacterium]|nr:7-carboxy-7-deazaguanine synthase QueE [Gemmatimonadota bacterium]